MNPLPLPTDNLYKFVALTGASLVVASFLFPAFRLDELEQAAQQAKTQQSILEVEISALESDATELNEDATKLDQAIDLQRRPVEKLVQEAAQTRVRLEELKKRNIEIAIKRAEVRGLEERNSLLLRQMSRSWTYLKILGFAGLIMALFGFSLWYTRVQRPTDLELLNQAGGGERHR